MTDAPAGPWALVVGMHRSGTSAVVGVLGALGFHMVRSDDRVQWPESNTEHWESLSVGLLNNDLLATLGGTWDAPPDLPEGWQDRPDLAAGAQSAATMAAAYPRAGPSAWKDPRLCLLLPYWRRVLPAPLAVVFIWRSPLDVAYSLRQRDGLDLPDGVALWERYNRSAVASLAGLDTYVVDFDTMVSDPDGFVGAMADWLGSLDQFAERADEWDRHRAIDSVEPGPHHRPHRRSADEGHIVRAEHVRLVEQLGEMGGGHRPLPAAAPTTETGWTTALIAARRRLPDLERRCQALEEELRSTKDRLVGTLSTLAATEQAWKDTRAAWKDTEQAWKDTREAWEQTQAVLADTRGAFEQTQVAWEHTQLVLADTQAELVEASRRLADLQGSTSWRVTKPLRSVASSLEDFRHRQPEG